MKLLEELTAWVTGIDYAVLSGLLWQGTLETLYMVAASSLLTFAMALPLGVFLLITSAGGLFALVRLNAVLGAAVNAVRSLPFVILMVALMPLTALIAGTRIGTTAAIVPLTLGTVPFTARLFETSLRTVPAGLIEAAHAMGASPLQIIMRVLIPEALPELIRNATLTVIVLISNSAMAGIIGGGGLGDLALRFGYMRFRVDVMVATVLVLIVMVQLVQMGGDYLARRSDHR